MKKLSYAVLKEQGYDGYLLESAPERVLQFGEGNFLRAFVDYFIDELNEKASQSLQISMTGSTNKRVFIPYFSVDSRMAKK